MKTRTKITVTLAVGIGLLIGSMGVASASPHYSDYNGRPGFTALDNSISLGFSHNLEWDLKAPVTSIEEVKVASLKDSGRLSGFTHHANIDRFHQEVVSFESGPVRPLA